MNKDLTEGKITSVLLRFSIPMFISVIFQQAYNIADSVVVGKFTGENALAAVGASYPITMILMAVAIGSNTGCSVVISKFFGSKDYVKTKTAICTSLFSALFVSVLLTVFGIFFTDPIMKLLKTPEKIFDDSALYLNIYIWGFTFLFFYNICTSIFTSLGDSKTPLMFLVCSSVGNVVLDLLFVAVFDWGVAGVAWATFIAQGVACFLALLTLKSRIKSIICDEDYKCFSWEMFCTITNISVPCVLQQSFVSVGNLFIQNIINGYGASVVAGYSAAIKLNTFSIVCFSTFGNSLSCFSAQNIGAKRYDRVRGGVKVSLLVIFCFTVPVFVLYFVFGKIALRIFLDSDSVLALETGLSFLRYVSPFYIVIGIKILFDGVLKSVPATSMFMITTFTDLVLRVVLAFVFSGIMGVEGVWLSWIIGWFVAFCLSSCFYMLIRTKILCEK